MPHPYKSLPRSSFWKTAVAKPGPFGITDLYRGGFPIDQDTAFVTAGSCFARNIALALQARGCNWLETEPPPPSLSTASAARYGYGMFSCRTGNIYSAEALRQWIDWAFGARPRPDEVWADAVTGRFFDPFRPEIEPDGFESASEVLSLRGTTIGALRSAIEQADVFIFTLGLTETWRNTMSGLAYPSCPGTVAGEFAPDRHEMVNAPYPSVFRDMDAVISTLVAANPKIEIVLTVSPIPLTATASPGAHVLSATQYSKSVLRAVAGALSDAHSNVSYFPSYEIFTAPVFRGMFFDSTLSKALAQGVDFAMSMFFDAHGFKPIEGTIKQASTALQSADATEVKCPDYILEYYAPK